MDPPKIRTFAQVLFHNGNTQSETDFEVCMRIENLVLPRNGYFGVSAATGGLAGKIFFFFVKLILYTILILCFLNEDDHDVKQFLTHSLYPPGTVSPQLGVEPPKVEEQQKLSEEYAEYQRKLDLQKEQ